MLTRVSIASFPGVGGDLDIEYCFRDEGEVVVTLRTCKCSTADGFFVHKIWRKLLGFADLGVATRNHHFFFGFVCFCWGTMLAWFGFRCGFVGWLALHCSSPMIVGGINGGWVRLLVLISCIAGCCSGGALF